MKVTRKLEVPTDIVTDIFCNKCGLSCKAPSGEFYGLIEAEITTGYYSTHLFDGDVHRFSLCERCLSDFMTSFLYPSNQLGEDITDDVDDECHDEDCECWQEGVTEPESFVSLISNAPSSYQDPYESVTYDELGGMDGTEEEPVQYITVPIKTKKESLN